MKRILNKAADGGPLRIVLGHSEVFECVKIVFYYRQDISETFLNYRITLRSAN